MTPKMVHHAMAPEPAPPAAPTTVQTPPVFLQLTPATKGAAYGTVIYRLFRGVHSPLIDKYETVSVKVEALGHAADVVQGHKSAEVPLPIPIALKGKLTVGDQVAITVVGKVDEGNEETIYDGTVGLRPAPR